MAKLAKNLAVEMNSNFPHRIPVDIDVCIKGALLHDIGKAIDEETMPKGNHIDIGEKICDMFDLDWKIKKCVSSHHDESYYDLYECDLAELNCEKIHRINIGNRAAYAK